EDGYGYDADAGELWLAAETPETVLLELESRRRGLEHEAAELDGRALAAERARAAAAAFAEVAHLPRRRANPETFAAVLDAAGRVDAALAAATELACALEQPLAERAEAHAGEAAAVGRRLRRLSEDEAELRRASAEAALRAEAAEREAARFGAPRGPAAAGDAGALRAEASALAAAAAGASTARERAESAFAEARSSGVRADPLVLDRLA